MTSTFGDLFGDPEPVAPTKILSLDDVTHDQYFAPQEFWLRTNGKTHTYTRGPQAGKTVDCTLEWCIHNINADHSTFKLVPYKTLKVLSAQSNCTPDYLIFVTIRNPKYKDSRFGRFCLDEALDKGFNLELE